MYLVEGLLEGLLVEIVVVVCHYYIHSHLQHMHMGELILVGRTIANEAAWILDCVYGEAGREIETNL